MASKCYWCEDGTHPGSLPNPIGNLAEPLGCCKQCQVLACGHHAQRHPHHQEYKCFDCLFIKLVISATIGLRDEDKQALADWDRQLLTLLDESPVDTYETFDQFKNDSSSYRDWFEEMDNNIIDFEALNNNYLVKVIIGKLNFQQLQLLAAAGVIISKIYENNPDVELEPLATVLNSRRFA